jgi:Recombinase zinc beta ribbon domain
MRRDVLLEACDAALCKPGRVLMLAGLLTCGICGRRMESCWSNGKPAYRCRHGHTSASTPDPARPKNAHIREDQILPLDDPLAPSAAHAIVEHDWCRPILHRQ